MVGFIKWLIYSLKQGTYRSRLAQCGEGTEISPTAIISYPQKIKLGKGCRVSDKAVLRANSDHEIAIDIADKVQIHESAFIAANNGKIVIGERSWVAPFCLIYGNGNVTIGYNVLMAPRVSINTVSHHADSCDIPINDQGIYCDPITIEDDVWIGINATILQGVTIGRGAIIGAGAVVNKDVPAWSVAVGLPAKVIGRRKNAPKDES